MFDTHCHLNFKAFKKILSQVITQAHDRGVTHIIIPGTDVKTSHLGVEIAAQHENIYAAVGIHPHHVMKYLTRHPELGSGSKLEMLKQVQHDVSEIEKLISNQKVVAVGEIGMDRHSYEETVYKEYQVDEKFLELQKELLEKQIQLALKYKKSLILHNREAKKDLLPILERNWDAHLEFRTVFHCCEPDEELLHFAKEHNMCIGIDGDLTYSKEKKDFIKVVPLGMLVLETDSPFLLPEPLKTQRKFPNEPKNIEIVAKTVAEIKAIPVAEIIQATSENAKRLFNVA